MLAKYGTAILGAWTVAAAGAIYWLLLVATPEQRELFSLAMRAIAP